MADQVHGSAKLRIVELDIKRQLPAVMCLFWNGDEKQKPITGGWVPGRVVCGPNKWGQYLVSPAFGPERLVEGCLVKFTDQPNSARSTAPNC